MANPDLLSSTLVTQEMLVDTQLASGNNDFTVPTGVSWTIKSATLCNTSGSAVTLNAWMIKFSGTARKFLSDAVVAAGDTLTLSADVLSLLPEAAVLRVNAGTGSVVDLIVSGISTSGSGGGGGSFSGIPDDGSVTNIKVATGAAISADKLADGTTLKVLTATERTKLAGIASGATVYTDEQVRDVIGVALQAGANVTVTPNDAGDTITIAATGGGGGSTPTPQTITYASTITPNAAAGVDFRCTATGDLTLAAPSSPTDGQNITVSILASGAVRTLTVSSAILLTTSVTPTVAIGSGKRWFGMLTYSSLGGAGTWYLLASSVQA